MINTGYIDGLITYLVELLLELLYGVFYPVVCFFRIFINVVVYIWRTFYNLFESMYDLFDSVYSYISTYLGLIFPSAWTYLLCLGLLIVFVLRIYHFVKDISIAGFKI